MDLNVNMNVSQNSPLVDAGKNMDSSQLATQRRSSSRSIRRKKFDDELVEYSSRLESSNTPIPSTSKGIRIRAHSVPSSGESPVAGTSLNPLRRPTPRSRGRSRHSRHSVSATKDLGRWKPTDDLALINAVMQTCDLRMVERGVKFSCRFTYPEISQRWQVLLYDPVVSRVAMAAIRNLHPDLVAAVNAKALYSVAEEELLSNIKSTDAPTLETFQQLLKDNPQVFYHSRTPKSLMAHWSLMKHYSLLKDNQCTEEIPSFSDAEEEINDSELLEPRDEAFEQEILIADRRAKREIRTLEEELQRLQVLVEMVPGASYLERPMDAQTLAVLRGRLVRYLMRSKEVTIGRDAKSHSVDINLNLEGAASKVSRRQGTIRLRNNGDFFLSNEGKRPFYVDGRPLLTGNKHRLNNNSVIEIAGIRFIFLIHQELINCIRQEATKLNVQP